MLRYLIFLLLPFLFLACDKDDDGKESSLIVGYQAQFGGEPLELQKAYDYGGFPVHFTIFNLYVSELTLVRSDNTSVKVMDVEFLNFNESPGNLTPVIQFQYPNIPVGEYSAVRLGIGVRADLNAKNPSDFATGHPLSREEFYWPGWESYIFTQIQGYADVDENGQPDLTMFYHTGSDAVYQEVTVNYPVSIREDNSQLAITIDLQQLFTQADGSLYDIVANPTTAHDPSNLAVGQFIMNNYQKAITVTQ
jgi:hypothetical protein